FGFTAFMVLAAVADVAFFPPSWNRALMSAGAGFFSAADLPKLSRDIFLSSVGPGSGQDRRQERQLLFYREGLNTTVTVTSDKRQNIIYLKNDGKTEAALPLNLDKAAATSDLPSHVLLGALPMFWHQGRVSSSFLIG